MSAPQKRTDLQTELRTISSSLDERDHEILHALLEHKVLTTHQLSVLFFRSLRRCQQRLSELKDLELISSFQPRRDFGQGRSPDHRFLTELGVSVLAHRDSVPRGELPWVPDQSYEDNRNLRHRMGVNAFFCALVEASRLSEGHCLHRWVPERKGKTGAGEIQPDGFGRYLHPGGACEFYLEYDRATEGPAALSEKLRSYLRFATGWGEGAAFPNVLVVVPHLHREGDVGQALHRAGRGRPRQPVPIFVTNEALLATRGMLGPAWLPSGSESERLCFTELPATDPGPYGLRVCLGRCWTERDRWSRISPLSPPPRFPPGPPRRRE
ncbi:MAG: replication-relaxation family protein [Actinomycetota bacterium]